MRLATGIVLAALAFDASAAELVLERVVLVSRHGVRSPTQAGSQLSDIAARAWPTWPVPPGYLTPRGERLATLMGRYYRRLYAARGLLPADGCPAPEQVSVWADVDQRTRLTGSALLAGMFPGCGFVVRHGPTDKPDPIFHPVRAGVCPVDTARARAAVLEHAGGSLETALAPYRDSVRRLQSVLGCCAAKLCQPGGRKLCTLADMPSTLDVRPKDGVVRLTGPIAIGSTASEIFLLEYAEGLPLNQVAWGRASSPARITPLLRLHRLQFDLIERTPYLAARQGTTLLHEVLAALRAVKPGGAAAASKLIVYVGHDTNLANIGGMLGIHWSLAGYLRDETPPAGALAFELLRESGTGRLFVRIAYYAQTLDQMRRATSLSLARPPARANVSLRGCADVERGGACPWSEFETRARKALDPECIAVGAR